MMGLIVNSDSGRGDGGGNFEKPKPGMVLGVLARYYDVGLHQNRFDASKVQHKVVLVWELQQRDSKGRQFQMFDTLTVSLYGDSHLKRRIEALLGRPLEAHEEDGGIDLDTVVGSCAMVILQGGEDDKVWIKQVDMLQDRSQSLRAEHDYKNAPRYVAKMIERAEQKPAADDAVRASSGSSQNVEHIEGGDTRDNQGRPVEVSPGGGSGHSLDDDIPF